MEWFRNLKVGSKLIGGFLVVAFIGAIIGIQGVLKSSQMNDMASAMYESEALGLSYVAEANVQLQAANRAIRSAMLSYTQSDRERHIKDRDARIQHVYQALGEAKSKLSTDKGRELFAQSMDAVHAYEKEVQHIEQILQAEPLNDQRASSERLFTVLRPIAARADSAMNQLMDGSQKLPQRVLNPAFNRHALPLPRPPPCPAFPWRSKWAATASWPAAWWSLPPRFPPSPCFCGSLR